MSVTKRKLLSLKQVFAGNARISFSQFGEDLLIMSALNLYHISHPTYLDIGANDPVRGNNTYFFYQRGFRGVLIEPNPVLYKKIKAERPGDVALNIGVGDREEQKTYYLFPDEYNGMNTFSEEEMKTVVQKGIAVKETIQLPLKNINDVIAGYFSQPPTILSIDVEGLDEMILRSLDFERYAPRIICVETVAFSDSASGVHSKRNDLISFIQSKGYRVFADTFHNTIFIS